jgi:hypothetical protein
MMNHVIVGDGATAGRLNRSQQLTASGPNPRACA